MARGLTDLEKTNVRAALEYVRIRCGGGRTVAAGLGYSKTQLYDLLSGRYALTAVVAYRIAGLAGVKVDDVLSGVFISPEDCPHCGGSGKAAQ